MVMSVFSRHRFIALAFPLMLGPSPSAHAAGQIAPMSDPVLLGVQEHRLSNGLQVLMVPTGPQGGDALHVRLLVRGGTAATGDLPPAAASLLAHSLFGGPVSKTRDPELENLLRQEEGLCESLRIGGLRQQGSQGERFSQDESLNQLDLLKKDVLEKVKKRLSARGEATISGSRHQVFVEADVLGFALDLPKGALEAWARQEAERLKTLDLARFPLVRESLIQAYKDAGPQKGKTDAWLLNTALPGRRYAQSLDSSPQSLERVPYSALKQWARSHLQPERMALVLVGNVEAESTLSVLQKTLGVLEAPVQALPARDECLLPLSTEDSFRRLMVSAPGESLLLLGWPIPPASHPDEASLRVLARVFEHRIQADVVEKGLGKALSVRLGYPGWRQESLLALSLNPGAQTSLGQLEESLWAIALDLQRRMISEPELNRAQKSLESDMREIREDAGLLAAFVGEAWILGVSCEGRLRERALGQVSPQVIQRAAQRYLSRSGSTAVLLEADPILNPKDPQEARMVKVLRQRLAPKVENPARLENVVRETLRQMRMLTDAERASTLALLEAQGAEGE